METNKALRQAALILPGYEAICGNIRVLRNSPSDDLNNMCLLAVQSDVISL